MQGFKKRASLGVFSTIYAIYLLDFVSNGFSVSSEVLEDRLHRFVCDVIYGEMEVVYLLKSSTALFIGRLESKYHGHSTC